MQYTSYQFNKAIRQLKDCELLGNIVKQHGKVDYQPLTNDPFDTLISSIISQQLSVKTAATIDSKVRLLLERNTVQALF